MKPLLSAHGLRLQLMRTKSLGMDLSGDKTVGYDVADSGADKNACVIADGVICIGIDEWKAPEDELVESALRAASHSVDGSNDL